MELDVTISYQQAIAEIAHELNQANILLPRATAEALGKRLKSGEGRWPTRSGRSRKGFSGDKRGVTNFVFYAVPLEAKFGRAHAFVAQNIREAANEQYNRALKAVQGV